MNKKIRLLIIALIFVFFFLVEAYSYSEQVSNDLSETFFRLHIIANSDSTEDQDLKLKVRDEITKYIKSISLSSYTKESTIDIIQNNLENIQNLAQSVVYGNGYTYNVSVEIGNFYFPTKYYGNISLPSGNYDALRIKIGEANGQNWWCSLFPPLCFINISSGIVDENGVQYLKDNLTDDEFSMISSSNPNINFKFKIIELFHSSRGRSLRKN